MGGNSGKLAMSFNINMNSDVEETENYVYHRPESIEKLAKRSGFTRRELQTMYRGFKQECPRGVADERIFKSIYAQFFPGSGKDSSLYAHYVFDSFDKDKRGQLTFEEFIDGLSSLAHGTFEDKLRWIFDLYDVNKDGVISRQELSEIVYAVYSLLGKFTSPPYTQRTIMEHVEDVFAKMDLDKDGVISMEEFRYICTKDPQIISSVNALNTVLSVE